MPQAWLQNRGRDQFFRKAKETGFRSRAAFKLLAIQEKFGFLRAGDVVVDLGAAPGGMTQVAAEIVGEKGLVVAVDIKIIPEMPLRNVRYLTKDILDNDLAGAITECTGNRSPDKLISDASPNFSGKRELDITNQLALARRAIDLSKSLLRKDGGAAVKVFECPEITLLEKRLASNFRSVRRYIAPATRRHSSELFLVALGKR